MWRNLRWRRLSFWHLCLVFLVIAGAQAAYVLQVRGLGPATHLGDAFPWGLLVGLNVFLGMALAVGGFALAAVVHYLDLENYRPMVRASLLTAVLGYLVALFATILDLGHPARVWSLITLWSPSSVLEGALWVVALYGVIVALEFAPELWRAVGRGDPPAWTRALVLPLLLIAVLLSTLQQSFLAGLLLLPGGRASASWSTPQLPVLFFFSAVCAGLAVILFASWHTTLAFGKGLSPALATRVGRLLALALLSYLCLRLADFVMRGVSLLAWKMDAENLLLALEICLLLVPVWLLSNPRTLAAPRVQYFAAALVLGGILANRLNSCITSVEVVSGLKYFPHWNEVMVSYSLIAVAVAGFAMMAKRWPVFPAVPA